MTTSSTDFDIQEKTDILIKSAFGFPSTNETKAWFLETAIPPNNYIVGEDILVESIPSNTDICFNTIVDASNIGLTSSDFLNYNTTNLTSASIVKDSTGVLIRFKKLILEDITGGSLQSWYKINSNINQDQLIPSGTNLLQNSLQFNTKQVGSDQPYLYSVFKTKDNTKLNFGSDGGNWFIDNKNGVLFFTDYPLVSSDINSTYPPAVTITTYIGKKGLSNFAGGGGGSASSANGNFNVTGDIIGSEDLELNAGIIIQDDFIIDSSATRVFPDARFENLEVRDGLTVYGDISTNNFNVVKNVTFSGDITSDTLNTANIIQFDQTGTTLDIDLSGDVYRNSISTFGDIDAGGNLSVSGDASLNGGMSVDGDASFNGGLSVGSDVSFNSGLTVGGNVGIGTDNPTRELHLHKENSSFNHLQITSSYTGTGIDRGFQLFTRWNSAFIGNREFGDIMFLTDNTERMRLTRTGDLAIANSNPSHKLDVNGRINCRIGMRIQGSWDTIDYTDAQSDYLTNDGQVKADPPSYNFSLHAENAIEAQALVVTSDRRIKDNIEEINDDLALQQLRQLRPSTYTYKDTYARGSDPVIGFIAQEVREVLPYAVVNETRAIPNILKPGIAHVMENDITELRLGIPLDDDIQLTNTSIIKINVADQTIDVEVVSCLNKNIIEIVTNEGITNEAVIVVYGEIVEDFHCLNKSSIFTVATAALQEVDRQQQADKAKIASLETENVTLKTQMADILARLAALESA